MMKTVRAIVREGRIQLLEEIDLPEGTEVLVTPLLDETDFWRRASESSLDAVWNNAEDNVYAQLLAE
ncbi:MAG: antitoxin family protein [Acidobacteriota bacterium]